MTPLKVSVMIQKGTRGRRTDLATQEARAGNGPPAPVSCHADRKRRQLALAYKIASLIESGEIASFADAAKRIGVTRARVTQIMDLQLLPMAEQERLLGCVRGEG